MNTFKKITLTSAVAFALFAFNACGDDSNSTSALGENGSLSSAVEDDESSSSINDDSSSSVIPGSSSSVILSDSEGSSSSSSVKFDGKSSSSSQKAGSSSSEFVFKLCEDGDTSSNVIAGKIYYNSCKNGQWNFDSIGNYVDVKPKVYPNMDSVFGSEFKAYGTYEDLRDNHVYRTTKYYEKFKQNGGTVIDSFTVMAQNLNYAEIMIDSTTKVFDDNKVEKRCYKDDPWYCDNYFGALYTWSEAMGLPKVCDSVGVAENPKCEIDLSKKVQGVCPTGWHVMTETEWKHFAYTNGLDMSYSLFSHAVWKKKRGNNPYGMSVLPNGDEGYAAEFAYFWMPQEHEQYGNKGKISDFALVDGVSSFSASTGMDKVAYLSIRCVLDEGNTLVK